MVQSMPFFQRRKVITGTIHLIVAIGRNIRSVDEELKKTDSGKGGDILSI